MRHTSSSPPAPAHPVLKLQRSIGNRAVGQLLKARALQARLRIHPSGDAYEREADSVADSVVQGNSAASSALTSIRSIQRDDAPGTGSDSQQGRLPPDAESLPSDKEPSTADKLKQAAQKTSDALRQTKPGKELEEQAKQLGKDFLSTLEGKVITGTLIGGALAAIVVTDSELPTQVPEVPLDWIAPGLKGKLTYQGKVREPSKVFLTLTFTPGGGAKKKPEQSETDTLRGEKWRLSIELEKFQQGLRYTPGSQPDLDAKAEREALQHWAAARLGIEKPVPSTFRLQLGDSFASEAWKRTWDNYFKLRRPTLPSTSHAGESVGEPANAAAPVMRKETATDQPVIPQSVENELRSPALPLDPETRGRMESSFGRDFSQVRIHTGPDAADSAESIQARAYTVGRDIVFGASQYAPGTSEGTRLLAHELTHTVQQSAAGETPTTSAPANPGLRFAQPPATPLEHEADHAAEHVAAGTTVGPLSSSGAGVQRQIDPKAALPPVASVVSALHGLYFSPVDKKAVFREGSGELQLIAMALRALLDNDYKPGMEVEVLDKLKKGPGGFTINPADNAGHQNGGETIHVLRISPNSSLQLLEILNSIGHPAKLGKDKVELLELGRAGILAFPEVQKLGLPPWYSETLFLNAIAQRAGLLRQFSKAIQPQPAGAPQPDTSSIIQKMFEALKPAATVLDIIRLDSSLIDHPAYRELWPPPKPASGSNPPTKAPAVMAAADQEPNGKAAIQFLTYVNTQPDLRDNILGDNPEEIRRDSKLLLDRFSRALGTDLFSPKVSGSGSQQLTDEPPRSNAPEIPSTLTVYPPADPPLFDASLKAEYAFEMHIQFPDIFTAFATRLYLFKMYPVPKNEVVGAASKPVDIHDPTQGQTFGNMDRYKSRLARDSDYNAEDLNRWVHNFTQRTGEPGVGLDSIGLNSLMRYVGTSIKTLIELLTDPRSLKRIRFPSEGLYIVAAFSRDEYTTRAEIVRLPSVAYLPIFVREPEVIAEARVQQSLESQAAATDRIVELVAKGADLTDEENKELAQLQAQTGGVEGLLKFQKKSLEDRKADTKNPPSAKETEQIDDRIKAIDRILGTRSKLGLGVATERLIATMVSDSGQTINLMLEVVDLTKPADKNQTWLIADSTTPHGHQAHGEGKDRLEAIRKGIKSLLEKGSYGRGQVSVIVDKTVLDFRIAADAAAQENEALANAALLLSIAAVAAAPLTGGASLSLLIPAGIVGAIPSAYRLAERGAEHTLHFDLESAMDVVNIVGAVVGLGAEAQLAKRSLWIGRALLISGVGSAGTGMVLMGAQLMDQIQRLEDLPAGMRAAQLTEILGNAMLQAGIMVGGALAARSRIGETTRTVEENESSVAKWRDESLDKPTREELDRNPEAKAAYAEMSETVRNLLTLCGSFCVQIKPPPTKAQVRRIEKLVEKLTSAADERWLKGYLHENRGEGMNKALERLEKVPADKFSDALRGMVTDRSIVVLMAFSEEFRTPKLKAAAKALMEKGTIPVEQIGGILDKVRRQKGGSPERMLRYLDKLGDAKPDGYARVLQDLETGGSLHKGAEWVLRYLCDSAGDLLGKVSKFEAEAEPGGRRWDFVINSQRYQLKSWSFFYEDTFLRQMLQDYRLADNFRAGVVKWVFDGTTGLGGKSDIVGMMGASLDRAAGTVDGYSRAITENIIRRLPEIVSVGLD